MVGELKILACFVFVWTTLAALGQVHAQGEAPLSEELYRTFEQREKRIREDFLRGSASEWEGLYSHGDHHPDYFAWSQNFGFVAFGSDHMSSPTRVNFGKARFENLKLHLEPERSDKDENLEKVALIYVPIKWGERHYLVHPDSIERFAYVVHSESEADVMAFLQKVDDYEKPQTGLPNLPDKYLAIMKLPAINAKVMRLERRAEESDPQRVILDKGVRQRVVGGMSFYFTDGCNDVLFIVTEVMPDSSFAYVGGTVSGPGFEEDQQCEASENFQIREGMKVTSKAKGFFKYPMG